MQLVAYGAQDIYLTGNPQITFFKVVYRRHTNFSMESIECTFNGTVDFGKKSNVTISRNGDLIGSMHLEIVLPALQQTPAGVTKVQWANGVGNALVKSVDVEIGGQQIDKHYGEWLDIWGELNVDRNHRDAHNEMVGHSNDASVDNATEERRLYVPLRFWFNRNPGLALPLIALQYHEVKINLELESVAKLVRASGGNLTSVKDSGGTSNASIKSCNLYVDYVYLDTDERRRFAQVSHEYLIEQLQFTGDESVTSTNNKIKLNFNHPCKELVWVVQMDACVNTQDLASAGSLVNGKQWFNYSDHVDVTPYGQRDPLALADIMDGVIDTGAEDGVAAHGSLSFGAGSDGGSGIGFDTAAAGGEGLLAAHNLAYDEGQNPVVRAKLQLNGHDRFSEREGRYFNLVQPYQHHENVPATGINVYSFGLKPEEHQPSGTCNMSRIDTATLHLTLSSEVSSTQPAKVRVYATNYNVLRIMSGMGGLAYSN
jgi:hypothetical protein